MNQQLRSISLLSLLVFVACTGGSSDPGETSSADSSATSVSGQSTGEVTSSLPGSGGAASEGSGGGADLGSGGYPVGSGGEASNAGGASGGSEPEAGPTWHGFVCPPGPFADLPFDAGVTVEQVPGLPPDDDFVTAERTLINMEGPVWLEGELYVSEINMGSTAVVFPSSGGGSGEGGAGSGGGSVTGGAGNSGGAVGTGGASNSGGVDGSGGRGQTRPPRVPPPARVLKLAADGSVSVMIPVSGSNGLSLDPQGALTMCVHETGSIERVTLPGGELATLVGDYEGNRFNSPNDLAFGPDGSLYFSDPDYQSPEMVPQATTRVYRVKPGSMSAESLIEGRRQPNGVTFSPYGETLYVSGEDGVVAYPVAVDGSVGAGVAFAQGVVGSSDGMGMDCAGNLYLTSGRNLVVVDPAGSELVRVVIPGISSVTNVAFGGADNKVIYVTGMGGSSPNTAPGVFRIQGAIPGMPY